MNGIGTINWALRIGSVPLFFISILYSISSPGSAERSAVGGLPFIVVVDKTPSDSGIYASTDIAILKII